MSPPSNITAAAAAMETATATREAASSRRPAWEMSVPFLQYPMLTRSNYFAWAVRTKVFMQAQGLWDAIQPRGGGAVDERTDVMALAVIYQGIPDEFVPLVAGKETAREAWEALETVHMGDHRGKVVRVQTLARELEALRMGEEESVNGFAIKVMGVVAQIRALGDEVRESYVIEKLLRAVPARLAQAVNVVDTLRYGNTKAISAEGVIGLLHAYDERLRGRLLTAGESDEEAEARRGSVPRSDGGRGKGSECRSKKRDGRRG